MQTITATPNYITSSRPYYSSSPPLSSAELLQSANNFFDSLSSSASPFTLLTHFSTTSPISIAHYPSTCPYPSASILCGPNAIRSYFDLIATHWTRSNLYINPSAIFTNPETRTVVLHDASVVWKWRISKRSWTEKFTCTLGFDEVGKIMMFEVKTESEPETCVMCAVDEDPNNGNIGERK